MRKWWWRGQSSTVRYLALWQDVHRRGETGGRIFKLYLTKNLNTNRGVGWHRLPRKYHKLIYHACANCTGDHDRTEKCAKNNIFEKFHCFQLQEFAKGDAVTPAVTLLVLWRWATRLITHTSVHFVLSLPLVSSVWPCADASSSCQSSLNGVSVGSNVLPHLRKRVPWTTYLPPQAFPFRVKPKMPSWNTHQNRF